MIETIITDNFGSIVEATKTDIMSWIEENLVSQANGSNLIFVTAKSFYKNTLEVFLNGQRLIAPDDYTITNSNTIQMVSAPKAGDNVVLKFVPVSR